VRKLLIVAAVISLLVFGVVAVYAQDGGNGDTGNDTANTPPCFGWGGPMMGGHMMGGMMWGGGWGGHMMWDDENGGETSMMTAVADALNMDANALVTELQSGKTIAEVADAQGVELSAVVDAALAVHTEQMAAAVESGALTQDQADAMTALMQANLNRYFTESMPCQTQQSTVPFGRGGMRGQMWGDRGPSGRMGRAPQMGGGRWG
jgi:hypothetical protein